MTNEQRVFVRGVKGRGSEVIKTLEDLGGKKPPFDIGGDPDYIYYISHEGDIGCRLYESEVGKIIMDFYREIKLPEQWYDGDILFSEADNEFAVFEEEYKIDSDKFLSYLATCFKGYLTYQAIRRGDFRLATKSEVAQFHERLHAINKDWDTEKKQLVDWKWKPKINEAYWFITGSNTIIRSLWEITPLDNKYFEIGNCFRTREEAEVAVERVKKALKGE